MTLLEKIRDAVREERYRVSLHVQERLEERALELWQIVAGLETGQVVASNPRGRPNPTVIVRHELPDGAEVEAVWAWLRTSRQALLVTTYLTRESAR
jgi:hypothetical protein